MDEVQASLELYETQRSQVEQALLADPDSEDLQKLRQDLDQLIALTTQNLLEEKKKALLSQLEEHEPKEGEQETGEVNQNCDDLKEKLLGLKCRAPHQSKGSDVSFMSNAIIFHVERGLEEDDSDGEVLVRVVFSHPVSVDMVPCPFFLRGKCRFEADSCLYSHGEVVALSEIKEFEEPNFDTLAEGSAVLANSGEYWRHAKVVALEGSEVHVRFDHGHQQTTKLSFEDVWPLVSESADVDDSQEESAETVRLVHDEREDNFAPVDLLSRLSSSSLGDWEKHTRGVGSRLMAQMGYVTGTGLGVRSNGRVDPVAATIYPAGKSLDWCMELRAKAGGQDALTVERTLLKQKEKEEKRSLKRLQRSREARKKDVFDFINKSLRHQRAVVNMDEFVNKRGSCSRSGEKGTKAGAAKVDKKSLNVQAFGVAEEIRRTERDVVRLKASYERHKLKDPATAAGIKAKMEQKQRQIQALRGRETSLNRERSKQDSTKKLTIF